MDPEQLEDISVLLEEVILEMDRNGDAKDFELCQSMIKTLDLINKRLFYIATQAVQ